MTKRLTMAALLALALPMAAQAQTAPAAAMTGTRLEVVAKGEVTRVPDIVRIEAGVVTQAPTASEAIRQNAALMARMRAAMTRAGIAARDIQTSSIGLRPVYHHTEEQPPQLIGYSVSNRVEIRFRDVAASGAILDSLVAAGANQINGPMLEVERPEAALDEARTQALTIARGRAELYARSLGMRVARILAVSETDGPVLITGMLYNREETQISPGERTLSVTLNVSFELQ